LVLNIGLFSLDFERGRRKEERKKEIIIITFRDGIYEKEEMRG
jgi:hypothetical protein